MTNATDDMLALLDEMNEQGRIEYADYSQLHDAIAATLGRGTLTAEQVSEAIERHVKFYEGGDYDEQAIADELNATLGSGTCEWLLEHSGTLYDKWRCSKCEYLFIEPRCDQGYTDLEPNYCPNCGAKVVVR